MKEKKNTNSNQIMQIVELPVLLPKNMAQNSYRVATESFHASGNTCALWC